MDGAVLVAKMSMGAVVTTEDEAGNKSEQLSMHAVTTSQGDVNKQWAKWTPSGQLQLQVNNPDAIGKARPGYYKVYLVPCGKDD